MEFMKPNYYLGVAFKEGPLFFLLNAREVVHYEPYEVGVVSAGGTTGLFSPKLSNGDNVLEPPRTGVLYQAFVGVNPEEAEVYLNYPGMVGRYSLDGLRPVPGPIKWIDGSTSPFDDPSDEAELITFRDLYPEFNIANESGRDLYVEMAFHIAKFTYGIVTDPDTIKKLIEGKKPMKFYSFIYPFEAPNWLVDTVEKCSTSNSELAEAFQQVGATNLFDYIAKLWKEVRGVR